MARRKQETMQAEIIQCSKRLFEQFGYANTSIRMITKEMGFKNQASFYVYFESKDKMTALILRKGSQHVHQYIDEMNLQNVGPIQRLLLENLIVTEILRDSFNRRFYTEAQSAQNFSNWIDQIPGYTKNIYDSISKEIAEITFDELQLNLYAYVKAVCGAFQAIDNLESQVTFEDAVKRLPSVFLEFMGVRYERHESIIRETRDIFSRIPEDDFRKLYFFN